MSTRQSDHPTKSSDDGFALLAVLGFMLVFAMFLMPFAAASRVKALTVSYEYDQIRLGNVAQATANYVAWRLSTDPRFRQSIEVEGAASFDCADGKMALRVAIIPHAYLIDLNHAEESLLQSGLELLDLDRNEAMTLARKIGQFRLPRPEEGEDATGVEGGFKHASFEDLTELHDFEALRGISLVKLSRIFSAYSGRNIQGAVPGASGHFTIETSVYENDRWASDIAVYSPGSESVAGRRIATVPVTDKPLRPVSGRSCESVLGPEIGAMMREIVG